MSPPNNHVYRLREGLDALRAGLSHIQHGVATGQNARDHRANAVNSMVNALDDLSAAVDGLEWDRAAERRTRDRVWTDLVARKDNEVDEAKALLEETETRLADERARLQTMEEEHRRETHRRIQAEERAEAAETRGLRDWDDDFGFTNSNRVFDLEDKIEDLKRECDAERKRTQAAEAQVAEANMRLHFALIETQNAQEEMASFQRKIEGLKFELYHARVEAAWTTYDALWAVLADEALPFSAIPWPVVETPQGPEDITPEAIRELLFSTAHSPGQTRRERVKRALLRWHPDKFGPRLQRVPKSERKDVQRAVNLVAAYLNDLLKDL
ncbi:hypothetical protein PsYK624_163920 [Phanerochaete sordida]|uniref:J domain-containing protein n=1 Tax=Phanerochaete sordida TaxID=48140 RepID=A0A9P3GQT0_9APHY|nr:hypothetical protein PsYK624_163920 [Phanerochaete sordida]